MGWESKCVCNAENSLPCFHHRFLFKLCFLQDKVHRVRASFSFHTTAVCLDWCAFLVEVSTSATFSEGISQECHSSSKSSPDREIKGKRERWESFHLKHPLMKCSRIQLLYPPKTLPLSRFQPNQRLTTSVLSCVFVSCAEEMEREGVLMSKSDGDCCCYV